MSVEETNPLIRRYGSEHYNQWNEALIDELVHPEVTGEYPGFDPTGYRFESGKIKEIRSDTDTLRLVQQLGYFMKP